MQLNIFLGPAKWVTKMTTKAKVALEEKVTGTSKKWKPVNDVDGDNMTAQLKKAKTHLAAGNAPTGNLTVVNQCSMTSSIEPSKSPTPPAMMSHCAVVHTEEEEATLSANKIDLDSKDSEKQMMKDWNSPVYTFFNPTPKIVEINGYCAHEFKCQAKGCKANVRCFLNKGDAHSTGNMHKHVHLCWGADVL
ncbi:uncharacterized protein BJ212DRAFT_1296263 [Suillus subaureus]|uniref:Uncharacterized protein n=1 Tax=Suillus subaureus TaxID=48587 RepID=A0A9P7EKM5_9AGAM|nr:uncharacterized protein BJ212DRAFT_1296263 [Suillus subaureus]KAG1823692.1 hypothetical protein BJ212DRAFT_1296263 [Suillus subaureus]